MNKKSTEAKQPVFHDIPLGGDYALDDQDNPVVAYEDRSGRRVKATEELSRVEVD